MTKRASRKTPGPHAGDPTFDPSAIRGAMGRAFLTALADDFARAGTRTIVKLRKKRPQDYLRLGAALLPKEFRIKEVEWPERPEISDAELDAMLDMVRKMIAEQEKGQGGEGGL